MLEVVVVARHISLNEKSEFSLFSWLVQRPYLYEETLNIIIFCIVEKSVLWQDFRI